MGFQLSESLVAKDQLWGPLPIIRGGLALEFKVQSPTWSPASTPIAGDSATACVCVGGGTGGSMRESLPQQMFPEHLMCEGQRGEAPGRQGQLCRAKLANPSPLTLPGPTPPLATPFSQPNSLEAIFLWEKKNNRKIQNCKEETG